MPVRRSPVWEISSEEFKAQVEQCTSIKSLRETLKAKGGGGYKALRKRMVQEGLTFPKGATRIKRSPVWKISSEEFKTLVDQSSSSKEILIKLGLSGGGSYEGIRNRMQAEGLDYKAFAASAMRRPKTPPRFRLENVLVENSTYPRSGVKRRVLEQGLLEEKCDMCGIGNEWQGQPLVLVLDHFNGINNDHRLENLRFLCPNCNSQTSTFAGRNINKGSGKGTGEGKGGRNCRDCQKPIHKVSIRCHTCAGAKRRLEYHCPHCDAVISKSGKRCRTCATKISRGELKPLLETVEAA